MRMVLGTIVSGLISGPVFAAPAAPDISVTVAKDALTVDTSRSHRELRARMLCERPGALSGHYLGLSHATVQARFHVRVYVRSRGAMVTGGLAAVSVELRLGERTVYVARELPEGSCAYKVTLAHEMRHVAIDDSLFRQFKPRLEEALSAAAANLDTVRGDTRDDILAAVRAPLKKVLQREMAALQQRREMRHAAFDTARAGDRPGATCEPSVEEHLRRAPDAGESWHAPVDCDNAGTSGTGP